MVVVIPEDLPEIPVDVTQIDQALGNLLENAATFSPVGTEIALILERQNGSLMVRVEDRGPGVPPDQREHVFKPFVRLASGGGAGLGLPISRAIVEAHGGRTDDRGLEGQQRNRSRGRASPRDEHHRRSRAGQEGPIVNGTMRVLVVDDDSQIVRALRAGLAVQGYDVVSAGNGETALELAAGTRVDLVLLDLELPGIDGVEVVGRLRGWTEVPVLVLSAHEALEDRVRALDAGADDYVSKPFAMEELGARIRAVMRRTRDDESEGPLLRFGQLEVDLAKQQVRLLGEQVRLTPTEYRLLEAMVSQSRQAPHPFLAAGSRLGARRTGRSPTTTCACSSGSFGASSEISAAPRPGSARSPASATAGGSSPTTSRRQPTNGLSVAPASAPQVHPLPPGRRCPGPT